jgi:hypothetical protein
MKNPYNIKVTEKMRELWAMEDKFTASVGHGYFMSATNTKEIKLKLPKPQRYLLRYRKDDQEVMYEVSNPIDVEDGYINVYVYAFAGHSPGIRSFKVTNIVEMKKIGASVKRV